MNGAWQALKAILFLAGCAVLLGVVAKVVSYPFMFGWGMLP